MADYTIVVGVIFAFQEGLHGVGDVHVGEIGVAQFGPYLGLVNFLCVVFSSLQITNFLNQNIKGLVVLSIFSVDDQNLFEKIFLKGYLSNIHAIVVVQSVDVVHHS